MQGQSGLCDGDQICSFVAVLFVFFMFFCFFFFWCVMLEKNVLLNVTVYIRYEYIVVVLYAEDFSQCCAQ